MESLDLVLSSPGTSYWLKLALTSALERDPVDAVRDAEALACLLRVRCDAALASAEVSFDLEKLQRELWEDGDGR